MIRAIVPIATLLLLMSGCAGPPERQFPELRFSHLPPIALDVAKIEVVERFKSPLASPHVEHEAPLAPAKVMRTWVQDRLKAVGQSGTARFIIADASLTFEELKKKAGLKGLVTTDQARRYRASMSSRLEVVTATGLGRGFAEAAAQRDRTVPEDITLQQQDDMLFQLVETAAREWDSQMAANITAHLKPFLK